MPRIWFQDLAASVRRRLPACGATRVVAVDGPSGAGKTDVADRLGAKLEATVVQVDDFVPGWHGLAAMPPVFARDVLAPIAAGEVGTARRWDWAADRPGDLVDVLPVPYLVLDGCGSGSRVIRPYLSLLIWVDAPVDIRRARAMSRDGEVYEPWWDVWAAQERQLFAAEQTALAADVRIWSG